MCGWHLWSVARGETTVESHDFEAYRNLARSRNDVRRSLSYLFSYETLTNLSSDICEFIRPWVSTRKKSRSSYLTSLLDQTTKEPRAFLQCRTHRIVRILIYCQFQGQLPLPLAVHYILSCFHFVLHHIRTESTGSNEKVLIDIKA